MFKKQLTIVSVSIEAAPFAKAGGLGDVARSLPLAYYKQGHKPIIIIPFFNFINAKKYGIKLVQKRVKLPVDNTGHANYEYYKTHLKKVPVYLIDVNNLFKHLPRPYRYKNGSAIGAAWRYYLYCLSVINLLTRLKICPNIIQVHDWHTAILAYLLKNRFKDTLLAQSAKTVLTIHNLNNQAEASRKDLSEQNNEYREMPLFKEGPEAFRKINYMKLGILHADLVTTVSHQYSQEIQTAEFGFGLERLLRSTAKKHRLAGIVNGIDQDKYNPVKDKDIVKRYSAQRPKGKIKNKLYLQRRFGLKQDPSIPLLSMVTRASSQKGFSLLFELMPWLKRQRLQLVILGSGDGAIVKELHHWSKQSENIYTETEFNEHLASQIYAGSDIFLMPSWFEPCGLSQMIAHRYGTVPVVHAVGGLKDTIENFDPRTGQGTGFVFTEYYLYNFLAALVRALEIYKCQKIWSKLVKKVMQTDHSWDKAVREYEKNYYKLLSKS